MSNENEQVKTIVTSYRLKEDVKEKIKQQLKELDLTQEQYFDKVVSLMELENVKQNSFLSKDTTIIQSNLDAILNAFISVADSSNNLISNKDAEVTELKNKYKDMILIKDNCITEQKKELQDVYNKLSVLLLEKEEIIKDRENDASEILKLWEQLEKREEISNKALEDKTSLIEQYKSKNDMLLSDLAVYKQYKDEVEQYKKLLADAQSRNIDLVNSIKDKDFTISTLNKNIENQGKENEKNIENIKKENELSTKLAIAEIKEQFNAKLSQQQEKHNKEIEQYQAKYKSLLEQLEKARTTETKKGINTAKPNK